MITRAQIVLARMCRRARKSAARSWAFIARKRQPICSVCHDEGVLKLIEGPFLATVICPECVKAGRVKIAVTFHLKGPISP